MKIWKQAVLFYLGGCTYMALELCWRGWTHGSMFLAGGSCFLLVGHLSRVEPRLPLPARMAVGAGIITMVELLTGLLVNRSYAVWDYRDRPGNFLGQICPEFFLLWMPVALGAMVIYQGLSRGLDRGLRSG